MPIEDTLQALALGCGFQICDMHCLEGKYCGEALRNESVRHWRFRPAFLYGDSKLEVEASGMKTFNVLVCSSIQSRHGRQKSPTSFVPRTQRKVM